MLKRTTDSLLWVLLLVIAGGAAFWTWTLVRQSGERDQVGRANSAQIDQLDVRLEAFGDLEVAYIASGRPDATGLAQALSALQEIEVTLAELLPRLAGGPAPPTGLNEFASLLSHIEASARDNIDAGFNLMAADLLFAGTRDARRTLQAGLRDARAADTSARALARSTDLKWIWAVWATVALVLAILLVRSSRAAATPPQTIAAAPTAPPTRVDIAAAADLCTDIGRSHSANDVPALLKRTAAILHASGVILWVETGSRLHAVAAHGYDPALLARLGPVDATADHATATAWRTGRLQTVPADARSKAAVAAPMLGADGCVGVLAVECGEHEEDEPAVQIVTRLVAAQLAATWIARPEPDEVPTVPAANAS